ncbi:unnamed protein product [Amoebophrya sp. A25]|nr:unnamed protein product [Amoebophrya sp. A25]|eukprot:GSA25T00026094001.1
MATASSRFAWSFLSEGMTFRAARLYETFWNSQSNLKWGLVVAYPSYLFYIRWRAETQYKYNVYLEKPSLYPTMAEERGIAHALRSVLFGAGSVGGGYWSNGSVFYGTSAMSVADLKTRVYGKETPPANLKVGCRGRMMEDSDNLALAVKSFCRRDPRILMWVEE